MSAELIAPLAQNEKKLRLFLDGQTPPPIDLLPVG
jgi:hypothetical protein